jgi:dihydrofolate synthase/folylpolyglutamate synthase
MNYESAVAYLLSLGRELAAPTQAAAAKFDLENITVLAERLGRPDRAYPSVHIAGTNGKGSTAAFLESILRIAGLRTGLNTSPHLERINERVRINGDDISDELFAQTLTRIRDLIEQLLAEGKLRAHPTYFESVTALAFEVFARSAVESAIFETGLGGRLDATNIITPLATIITRIDFDHENFLGHSLAEIAGEKAGILKPGIPVIITAQLPEAREVLLARAKQISAPVIDTFAEYRSGPESNREGCFRAQVTEIATGWSVMLAPGLPGRFQLQNALNAAAAARVLQSRGHAISDDAIARGIATAEWPGRIEKINTLPDIYLDGAHNPGAARELAKFIQENFVDRKIFMLFGALRDKAVDEVAGLLFPLAAEVIFTEARTIRAISARQLAEIAGHHAPHFSVVPSAEQAFDAALAKAAPVDAIFITGSLYLVGQLRQYWKQRRQLAVR